MPFYASRGDYQANGNLYESDIVGSIANAIGSQVGKLNPQIVRQTAGAGLQIKRRLSFPASCASVGAGIYAV